MSKRTQSAASPSTQPLWMRWFAAFCVLLAFGAGTAQAAHVHGQWFPHHAAHVGAALDAGTQSGEEHCQLCQAMHSALPVASSHVAPTGLLQQARPAFQLDRLPEIQWQFAMFSRPPPRSIS